MKKLTLLLALLTGATLAYGQGTITFNTLSPTFTMRTNSQVNVWGEAQVGGTRGATTKVVGSFYYTLLIANYEANPGILNDPLSSLWEVPNHNGGNGGSVAGSVTGPGGTAGAPVAGWGAPTGNTYDTSERNYYMIIGWSANLGNNWGDVSSNALSGWTATEWTGNAFYGYSAVGNGYSGGGASSPALLAPNVFGVSSGMPGGITSGFDLFLVTPVPEPTSFALAGLGAAALLIFRRRK